MTQTIEGKVQQAAENLKGLKNSGGELSPEQTKKLRDAKKSLKRAQRSMRTEQTRKAKTTDMDTRRQKNVETAQGKAVKKKQSADSALNAVAQEQVKADSAAEEAGKQG